MGSRSENNLATVPGEASRGKVISGRAVGQLTLRYALAQTKDGLLDVGVATRGEGRLGTDDPEA